MNMLQFLVDKYKTLTLTLEQAAVELHMKPNSLRNALNEDRLNIPSRIIGGKKVIYVHDLAAYLENVRESA